MEDVLVQVYWHGFGLSNPNSGIYRYAERLMQAMDPEFSIRIYGAEEQLKSWSNRNSSPLSPLASMCAKYGLSTWPETINADVPTVIHGHSNFNIPLFGKHHPNVKRVLTVHDLIPLLSPNEVSKFSYIRMRTLLPLAMKKADLVIAVSPWTKETLVEAYPQYSSKIEVIGHGRVGSAEPAQEKTIDGITRVFMVARGEPYKEILLFRDIATKLGSDFQCTLVTDARGLAQIGNIHLGNFHILQNIDSDELEALYRKSDLYVHTSRYEGYGLPAIEAMRYGKPVIYRGGTALNTTVGHAGVAMAANATRDDWVEAIHLARQTYETAESRRPIFHHYDKLPTWNEVASQLLQAYQRAANL